MELVFDRNILKLKRDRGAKLREQNPKYNFLTQNLLDNYLETIRESDKTYKDSLSINLRMDNADNINSFEEINSNKFYDLIISNLDIETINNLPQSLNTIYNLLSNEGMFIGAIIGGDSFANLKKTFIEAELRLNFSVTPHFMPLIDIKDMGRLLQNAKFKQVVSDKSEIDIEYDNLIDFFYDLRANGLTNITASRSHYLQRSVLQEVLMHYQEQYNNVVRFEIIYFTGTK